jgi:hypothetical protein
MGQTVEEVLRFQRMVKRFQSVEAGTYRLADRDETEANLRRALERKDKLKMAAEWGGGGGFADTWKNVEGQGPEVPPSVWKDFSHGVVCKMLHVKGSCSKSIS